LAFSEDIKEVVPLEMFDYYKVSVDPTLDNISKIEEILQPLRGSHNPDPAGVFYRLELHGYPDTSKGSTYEQASPSVCWSAQTGAFSLMGADTLFMHEYWDGAHMTRDFVEGEPIIVDVDGDFEELDTYDKRYGQKCYLQPWQHGQAYNVTAVNGQPTSARLLRLWGEGAARRDVGDLLTEDVDNEEEQAIMADKNDIGYFSPEQLFTINTLFDAALLNKMMDYSGDEDRILHEVDAVVEKLAEFQRAQDPDIGVMALCVWLLNYAQAAIEDTRHRINGGTEEAVVALRKVVDFGFTKFFKNRGV
jgi:hypothetical protein